MQTLNVHDALEAALRAHANALPDESLADITFRSSPGPEGKSWWTLQLTRIFGSEDPEQREPASLAQRRHERTEIIRAWQAEYFSGPKPAPLTPPASRPGRPS